MKYDPASQADRRALATKLREALLKAGFALQDVPGEETYERPIPQLPGVSLRCLTTIVADEVRDLGEDAIRISANYKRPDLTAQPLFKYARVFRTGELDDIVVRTVDRLREAFVEVRRRDQAGLRCYCGAPKFDTKSGKQACAALCWLNKEKA